MRMSQDSVAEMQPWRQMWQEYEMAEPAQEEEDSAEAEAEAEADCLPLMYPQDAQKGCELRKDVVCYPSQGFLFPP